MEETESSRPADERAFRYQSLRDYLRVIRRQRVLVVGITLLIGASALVLSLVQEKRYDAQTNISFRDPLQDLTLIGDTPTPELAPATRARIHADRMSTPRVALRVQEELDTRMSLDALIDMLDTTVDLNTALVTVTASSSDPEFAAEVANAFAQASAEIETARHEARLEEAEETLRDRRRETLRAARAGDAGQFDVTGANAALARIQNLIALSEPVAITSRALVPDEAAAPKPVRNTGLGLAVGLALALIAAFVRDILDRRLRTAHDAHQELGLPVLARVADSAFGYPGLARQNGLVMREADFEAFRVLRTNLAFLGGGRSPRSVLVTSGMPEEGKSTVSMALASAAAVAGKRVLLVECDLRRPSFARRLGLSTSPGLADYLREEAGPQEVVRTVELYAPWSMNGTGPDESAPAQPVGNLACITAGSRSADAVELFDSDRFRDFIGVVSRAYDLVVLDCSPLLAVGDPLRIAPVVDGVLICARMLQTTREEAKAVRSALENLPERPAGTVVTGLSRTGPDAYEYYYGY